MAIKCDLCHDNGIIVDDETNVARQCICIKQNKLAKIIRNSRMPEHSGFTFESYKPLGKTSKIAFRAAVSYVEEFPSLKGKRQNSIAFLGRPGSGKTHLALAIANQLVAKHQAPLLYLPYREVCTELKSAMRNSDGKSGQMIEAMKRIEVLVWDDLFKGRQELTDYEFETIFEIVNYRYLNDLPMIISSERLILDILWIDEAIGSRIREMAYGKTFEFGEESKNYRLENLG